jgi:hypothetical protein
MLMAEKALKKVEDQLNCSVCLEVYKDPKLLQCFHIYCRQCLVNLLTPQRLVCPICRFATPLPAGGVAGLPSAFHINHLLEIVYTHKKEDLLGSNPAGKVSKRKATLLCPDHAGKKLDLYCESCEQLVCLKCAIKGGRHHNHDCEELQDEYKTKLSASLKPLQKQMSLVNTVLSKLDARAGEISDERAFVEADIHNSIERVRKDVLAVLDVRETDLINQLDKITQGKLKGLAVQRDHPGATRELSGIH